MKLALSSALLMSLAMLTACDKQGSDKATTESSTETSLSGTMAKAAEEARKEIRTGNMSVGDIAGKAKAEITPQGDLLIDDKPVTITSEQRQLLIRHRELLGNVAISGMELGMQGVDLAKKAVGESIKGLFTGESGQIEQKVEAEAKKIEASAKLLCEQLPLLLESQQKLAESLPEFKPYATMTEDDFDDCNRQDKIVERK